MRRASHHEERPAARPDDQRAHHQHDRDEAHLRLRLAADAHDHAGREQRRAAASDDRADQQPADQRRAQQIERGRRDEMANRQREPGRGRARGAITCDRRPPPTSRAISAATKRRRSGARADGNRKTSSEPGASSFIAQAEQRNQRRLIRIAERGMGSPR